LTNGNNPVTRESTLCYL